MKRKHNEGFTLVEMLVSIVILAAIVLPTCTSLVLSYRLNAKAREMMQAQLAVSSTVEKLMAEGINTARAKALIDQEIYVYDSAWDSDRSKPSETDDYPGVTITITEDKSTEGYFSLSVSDDDGFVTVTTQIRAKGGASS